MMKEGCQWIRTTAMEKEKVGLLGSDLERTVALLSMRKMTRKLKDWIMWYTWCWGTCLALQKDCVSFLDEWSFLGFVLLLFFFNMSTQRIDSPLGFLVFLFFSFLFHGLLTVPSSLLLFWKKKSCGNPRIWAFSQCNETSFLKLLR